MKAMNRIIDDRAHLLEFFAEYSAELEQAGVRGGQEVFMRARPFGY
jgi:hypothetical protein